MGDVLSFTSSYATEQRAEQNLRISEVIQREVGVFSYSFESATKGTPKTSCKMSFTN